jgi:hypothetical protein
MNDLDLIEAAGRAAGYEVRRYRVRELEVVQAMVNGQWAQYDPLRWAGDAWRLQVDCLMAVEVGDAFAFARVRVGAGSLMTQEPIGDDAGAAARRAITRAAEALHHYRIAEGGV